MREGDSMPVMFLGGPLDHTVRRVRKAHGAPAAEVYKAIDTDRPMGQDIVEYDRIRVEAAEHSTWCYVRRGYNPPRAHVIDAMPPFLPPCTCGPGKERVCHDIRNEPHFAGCPRWGTPKS